jgi:hypothetical protein
MRKTLFVTTILLALAAWGMAQQEPSSQSSPSTSQGTASQAPNSQSSPNSGQGAAQSAGQNSVQGCLGGSGNNFTVTDKSGTSYQLQLPAGANASALKPHIGEEVRVEGDTASASGSNSAAAASGNQPTINVKNIYRVSPTCSTKSGAPPKQ